MFCNKCGKKISDSSLYCEYCDIKNEFKETCPECGKLIKKHTLFCPYCGNQLKKLPVSGESIKKSKGISVILAVFLGCWTWVYTWKKDWWKFITSIVILLTLVFVIGGWVFLVGLVFSILAIIDTSIKKDKFYKNYPNG